MLNDPELDYGKLICVLEACFSGAFIPDLVGSNRIIITSVDADHEAAVYPETIYGIPVAIPAWAEPGPWFSIPLIESLSAGNNFRDAFLDGVTQVDFYITKEEEQGDIWEQSPLLDDNGDGIGNHDVPAGGDGLNGGLAEQTFI